MANFQNCAAHLLASTPDPKPDESPRQVARFRSHTVQQNDTQALGIMSSLETKEISLTSHVESIYVQPRP